MVEYIVNCRECGFHTFAQDFQNADRARDGHELEMFNWRSETDVCGPCAIAKVQE